MTGSCHAPTPPVPSRRAERSTSPSPARAAEAAEDRALAARTLAGDPAAFEALLDRHHASLLRLARAFGHGQGAAEAVVRASWSAVLEGLAGFGFDRALGVWMMGVVAALASRSGEVAASPPGGAARPAVAGERFDRAGRWSDAPGGWDGDALRSAAAAGELERAIGGLPRLERVVLTLRDVEGLGARDTGLVLGLDPERQRALLVLGRARLLRALDRRLGQLGPHLAPAAGRGACP